jgi:hypothetical protein
MPHRLSPGAKFFIVCPSEDGLWIARETHGLAEGLFLQRRDAVRFAMSEGGTENMVCLSDTAACPSWRDRGQR